MSVFFFDTSALVKRYFHESGSGWVQATVIPSARHAIFISQITPVEVMSSLTRRRREGSLTPRTMGAARLFLNRHVRREYFTILLTAEIIQKAQDLLEVYPLRADDAIQLGCTLETNRQFVQAGEPPITFVSSDSRLLSAAAAEGLPVYQPT